MKLARIVPVVALTALAAALAARGAAAEPFTIERNFAGSVQLNYMAVPSEKVGREQALDGATVELSLKVAMDFGDKVQANVKLCVA